MCDDRKFYEDFRQGLTRKEVAIKYGIRYNHVCRSISWYETYVAPYPYLKKLYCSMIDHKVNLKTARRVIYFLTRNVAYSKTEVKRLLKCTYISETNNQILLKDLDKEREYCELHPEIGSIYLWGTGPKIIAALMTAERDCK